MAEDHSLTRAWREVQEAAHKQRDKRTLIKLPCCGTSVEPEGRHDHTIVCPNCKKLNVISWSLNPKVRYEL